MNVSLSPELEQLVQKKVQSGQYLSANEVIGEALRLLEDRDALRELKRQELRRFIEVGLDQADRGELATLDVDSILARVRSRKAGGE